MPEDSTTTVATSTPEAVVPTDTEGVTVPRPPDTTTTSATTYVTTTMRSSTRSDDGHPLTTTTTTESDDPPPPITTDVPRSDGPTTSDDHLPVTTTTAPERITDGNRLSNDLEDTVPDAGIRKQKQLDLGSEPCPCRDGGAPEPSGCVAGRTAADPGCPCRRVCARQSGQSCASPAEPCDEEFGLHCLPRNGTCAGPLSIRIVHVTQDSAEVTWGTTSDSELQPQALVFYATAFRGAHTPWSRVVQQQQQEDAVGGRRRRRRLRGLQPDRDYFVKVEEDGRQEVAALRTLPAAAAEATMPKILVKQRGPATLTVVWDDFRLPSYHSEYVLEYRRTPADGGRDDDQRGWTKVQAGTQTMVTVSGLTPATPYQLKVAVWEDDRMELPSELITARTADGCVREGRAYGVGEEFFRGCDFRCVCGGGNESDCGPRCSAPYVRIGSKTDDPRCHERALPSDPCCVTLRCTESVAIADLDEASGSGKSGECPEILEDADDPSCHSDCDHDSDCDGALKCCPSSCGGAVCAKPLHSPGDVCDHVYCGPNAECVASRTACVCSEGFEGDPHDFIDGCRPSVTNASSPRVALPNATRIEAESDPESSSSSGGGGAAATTTTPAPDESGHNELRPPDSREEEGSETATDAPFQLDLRRNNNDTGTGADEAAPRLLFDGCEYGNVTYDRDARFEDGCDALCVCEGRGHVTCVPRCSALSSGSSPACREVPDPDDPCCRIMVCSLPAAAEPTTTAAAPEALAVKILSAQAQNGTSLRLLVASRPPTAAAGLQVWYRESSSSSSSEDRWQRGRPSRDEAREVRRGVFEVDVDGLRPQTDYFVRVGRDDAPQEFSNTVQVRTFPAAVNAVADGCFHRNRSYAPGEVFERGCEHRCVCRERGFIECQDRCALYVDTVGYEGCDWVPSEEDPCCSVPLCDRRKKIPTLVVEGGRPPPPLTGGAPVDGGFCVADDSGRGEEVYRVGDIWESADGCRTRICRCTRLANGTTQVQCQSECPPLPPNAHLPTPRCPRPRLVKPEGPCRCPYVSCEEVAPPPPPRHAMSSPPPAPRCEYKGDRYEVGREFYDGCLALCHCGRDLRVECAAVECPYHFGAEFTECLEWDIDPDFFPLPPDCCAPATCKNDGSCTFGGRRFRNFEDIPGDLLPCGARCVCVNGNVTCENRCAPLGDRPPPHLPCPPDAAYTGHPEGDTCCLQWMCREEAGRPPPPPPAADDHCAFQGGRYRVGERWEVRQGSQLRSCGCHPSGATGRPEVECRGGCPQIPQKFLLPTDQCLRPVVVHPEDPLMCPYVVCNNTVSGQELYNVNVVALNSTAVRIRFSLSGLLVGLIGHAELHFTADPALPPRQWHVQKFSRPKRLFDSPNIEYVLNALRPNTTYFLRVRIRIDALQGGPESELFKLTMPPPPPSSSSSSSSPETTAGTTTTTTSTIWTTTAAPATESQDPIEVDPRPEAHAVDARTVRVSWRNLDPAAKRHLYALRLRYRAAADEEGEGRWTTTPLIHRDVTSYLLHDLRPGTRYRLEMEFVTGDATSARMEAAPASRGLEFGTPPAQRKEEEDPPQEKDPAADFRRLRVSVADSGSDRASFLLSGVPRDHVHVVRISYRRSSSGAPPSSSSSFAVPDGDRVDLEHLEPDTRYVARLELYLTDGRTLTTDEVDFSTGPAAAKGKKKNDSEAENVVGDGPGRSSKQQQQQLASRGGGQGEDEAAEGHEAYFIALVVVAVVAAVAGFGFVLLLVLLVRRQASAKALPISRTPSESAYDNPTYKTYDGERPEDKTTNGQMQTTQA